MLFFKVQWRVSSDIRVKRNPSRVVKVNQRGGGTTPAHQSFVCDCYVLLSFSAFLCNRHPVLVNPYYSLSSKWQSFAVLSDMTWPHHHHHHRLENHDLILLDWCGRFFILLYTYFMKRCTVFVLLQKVYVQYARLVSCLHLTQEQHKESMLPEWQTDLAASLHTTAPNDPCSASAFCCRHRPHASQFSISQTPRH